MDINWWYYFSSDREKPIIYIGNISALPEDKIIIQDDGGLKYVGVYRINPTLSIRYLSPLRKKKITNDFIKKRLKKIIDGNFIQLTKDFLDRKDDIGTIL